MEEKNMKEHWNRIWTGFLVIVLLSACGKGTGQAPLPASPGAGSTDAQQTEAAAAATDDQLSDDQLSDDQLPAETQHSLEEVFRNHDSFTDTLSKWNSKADPKRRSAWRSNLTPEEEQSVIDSMNAAFLGSVLDLAYERLDNAEDLDYESRCLAVLLQHEMISRETVDRYLLASSLYADNLAEELWEEIDQAIEKGKKDNPDLFPEPEQDMYYEDGMDAAMAYGAVAEEDVMDTEQAVASETPVSNDVMSEAPERTQNKTADTSQSDVPEEQTADPDGTPVPNTAEYNTIRENPFKSTASSPLSTFSIDVDTAGYTKLKYDILDGFQIEKDEVKIEELINYFNYDYNGDRVGEEPFTVSTEYTCCPWNPEHRLVRIGIRADDRQEKPATNFVLVTDISGSMMLINKLPLALSAYADMLDGFDEEDTISLMYYASGPGHRPGK